MYNTGCSLWDTYSLIQYPLLSITNPAVEMLGGLKKKRLLLDYFSFSY